ATRSHTFRSVVPTMTLVARRRRHIWFSPSGPFGLRKAVVARLSQGRPVGQFREVPYRSFGHAVGSGRPGDTCLLGQVQARPPWRRWLLPTGPFRGPPTSEPTTPPPPGRKRKTRS
ncbi:unnamed protein product, partial [Ectocarpus sp. 12 AP-2014]